MLETEHVNFIRVMDKYVSFNQPTRVKRRIHGLQFPLHGQQVLGWAVLVVTFIINMHLLVRAQYRELEVTSEIVYVVLYVSHAVSQLFALLLDPGEAELRHQTVGDVAEFDRRLHAHVIEHGRCHLCNIFTTSNKTKHCSLCNKCVYGFDHHCRWLNNCVGKRNYLSFISCVVTALLISVFTLVLCIVDIIFYAKYPSKLSAYAQEYVSCIYASIPPDLNETCYSSIAFITLITIYMTTAFCIMCALFHLCIFHVYIGIIGVSTYEYIVNQAADIETYPQNKIYYKTRNILYWRRIKNNKTAPESNFRKIEQQQIDHVDYNFSNLVTSIINNELEKARKIFIVDKSNVYPKRRDSDYS